MAAMEALRKDPTWQYPLETLKQISPSIKDGISYDDILNKQSRGVRFLAEVCDQLHLPVMTIYAAITYLQRFYLRYSLKKVHCFDVAGACIFLASKVEETARRLKEVAIACTRVALKQPKMVVADNSKDLLKWMNVITHNEELLLEATCFDFEIPNPYNILKQQMDTVGIERTVEVQHTGMRFINETCKTLVPSVYKAETVAAATILWTVHSTGIEVQQIDGKDWWQVLGFERSELVECVNTSIDMLKTIGMEFGEPVQ